MDHKALIYWFQRVKRPLPWRESPTPYSVWVSEVMLQQTRASVVIPYFERWMERFPTIAALANAPLDEVIKAWEGLGYYSRARNLHAGAQQVVSDFDSVLPNDPKKLERIKGLGPYTIGAIRSFAFHERAAAVDGNVLRVVTRFDNDHRDIGKPATVKAIRERVEELLPKANPWVAMEALIELGATHCSKKPECTKCPLRLDCEAFSQGNADQLPIKEKKTKITKIQRTVLVIQAKDSLLVRQVPQGQVMAGLWEFPYFEGQLSSPQIAEKTKEWMSPIGDLLPLPKQTHTFTRYHATLLPFSTTTPQKTEIPSLVWVTHEELADLPFSSGHGKIRAFMLQSIAI